MSKINRMQELAGISTVSEDAGSEIVQLGRRVMEIAEANTYQRGADDGNLSDTDIASEAKRILSMVERNVMERISSDYDNAARIEQEMDADLNMRNSETNF